MVHTWARRFFHSKDGETKFDPKFNTNDVTVVSVSLIGCWSVRIFTRSKNNQSETRRYMVLLGPIISCVCPFYFALSMSPLLKTKPSRFAGMLRRTDKHRSKRSHGRAAVPRYLRCHVCCRLERSSAQSTGMESSSRPLFGPSRNATD